MHCNVVSEEDGQRVGRSWMVLRILLWIQCRKRSSVLEIIQSSEPYNIIGKHNERYSFREVSGCKLPNRDPTEFNAKNALLPAVALSLVLQRDGLVTALRIPR